MTHHLILGAGPAGVIATETIRKQSPYDTITLVGDEPEPPYSRMAIPYLLMGNIGEEGTYLRKGKNHFALQRIQLLIGRAKSVDTVARSVQLDDGVVLPFDRLLIATGSVAAAWFDGESPPIDALIIGSIDEPAEASPAKARRTGTGRTAGA